MERLSLEVGGVQPINTQKCSLKCFESDRNNLMSFCILWPELKVLRNRNNSDAKVNFM